LNSSQLFAAIAAAAAHRFHPPELFAVEVELQPSLRIPFVGVRLRRPGSAIPHHDGPGAVLLRRNYALEVTVFQRVILDVHRQTFVVGIEARALGYSPAQQHAVEFQPEIVVEPARRMFLDDECKLA
jgi:hypothetical protein